MIDTKDNLIMPSIQIFVNDNLYNIENTIGVQIN